MSDGANLGNEETDSLSVREFLANVNYRFDQVQIFCLFFLAPLYTGAQHKAEPHVALYQFQRNPHARSPGRSSARRLTPGFGFLRLIRLMTRHVRKPVPQPADEDGRGDDGSKAPRAQVNRVSRARQTLEDQPVQAKWKHRVLEAQRRFLRRDPQQADELAREHQPDSGGDLHTRQQGALQRRQGQTTREREGRASDKDHAYQRHPEPSRRLANGRAGRCQRRRRGCRRRLSGLRFTFGKGSAISARLAPTQAVRIEQRLLAARTCNGGGIRDRSGELAHDVLPNGL